MESREVPNFFIIKIEPVEHLHCLPLGGAVKTIDDEAWGLTAPPTFFFFVMRGTFSMKGTSKKHQLWWHLFMEVGPSGQMCLGFSASSLGSHRISAGI